MSAAEVWSYVQFALFVCALVWCMYLTDRIDRTEVRLAETRIDLYALVDALEANADVNYDDRFMDRLRTTFPHLYDVDEREADERAAERAS